MSETSPGTGPGPGPGPGKPIQFDIVGISAPVLMLDTANNERVLAQAMHANRVGELLLIMDEPAAYYMRRAWRRTKGLHMSETISVRIMPDDTDNWTGTTIYKGSGAVIEVAGKAVVRIEDDGSVTLLDVETEEARRGTHDR